MNRRKFMLLLVCAATPSVGAQGQQGVQRKRIGFLWESPTTFPDALAAFRQELRRLGYVEGEDLVIEFRWAEGKPERMRELAEELVRLPVDVLVAPSSVYTAAAKAATMTYRIFREIG